jgi:PAS domain-containing protein
MAQHGIETILMRRLASRLTMPIVLVDPRGDLVYHNEAAGTVLGRGLVDTGAIARGEWSSLFRPANPDGSAVKREEMPLFIATEQRQPSHRRAWVRGLDGVERDLEGIAFPLIGQGERMLGAVGVFWDHGAPPQPGRALVGGPIELASPGGNRPVELLLMRQLASYLTTAILLVGAEGGVLFFNEPAEALLGRRFEEIDLMYAEEWSNAFEPRDANGRPIPFDDRPMIVALRRQAPAHRRYTILGFDRCRHEIEGLAFPLVNTAGCQLGALGVFWEQS